ncbi:MAG: CtsR family transcriptional regulator [Firmicutes bacterium]|uniref:Transcriptional regulator CtsR n=1 Tax=Candidatus Gallilactobacillus intestinavium TaxID=2840838 RepID=A0A9D9E8J7_9LACO|nr:CtsR family transcriptional regulator [Candidatus Gallilactobacillus intestinavium]
MDNSANISDVIEQYLKQILGNDEQIEIRRADIANQFHVVPSQINYVINTRFTIKNGYIVESKRGGGGYIRIEKVNLLDDADILDTLLNEIIGNSIDQRTAYDVINSLYSDKVLTEKEANIILSAIDSDALNVGDKELENALRAQILTNVLNRLRYEK